MKFKHHTFTTHIFQISANFENVDKLAAMIYVPYKCYVAKYETYEEEVLEAELNSIRLVRIIVLLSVISYTVP